MIDYLKVFKKRNKVTYSLDQHLESGMIWLTNAHMATKDGGVSIRYSLFGGWESSYPETTGYIIPTFFDYEKLTNQKFYSQKAITMADWELSIQQQDGSFIGGAYDNPVGKLVFDTGQIIFGLIASYKYTQNEKYLNSAIKAGDWLISIQDKEGYWKKYSYNSIPHVYHARVAWAILMLYKEVNKEQYLKSVLLFTDWVLSNQQGNGWFKQAGFTLENSKAPYTHTIAYTIRGILEIGMLIDKPKYIEAATRSADMLLNLLSKRDFYWGKYDNNWDKVGTFSCLTGNAQIAIIFFKLYKILNNNIYKDAALKLNNYLKTVQMMTVKNNNFRGAIAGSFPIWGEYERFAFPNWATKFYVDSLIEEKKLNYSKNDRL